ncbi:RHS repeat-associated core domain-containing protein [Actinokineospora alba]|uniref:RHS repeat-associated core domain-containing protein n=1 Tax=Actinokineospora alba TaxID=504798 RepID=A0A1H0KFR9_9PSEU|nr:DUF6531 domain-containing protein [Actinokineospora alba]TDP67926.1 RHS repeat-associated protein [Actinokineospora alba]SDH88958.1 RHS repeat-associated core domain-containing protein [Actinokineospora alba]SDO54562.1 RHS repeat-associated core domain-containing protein [Actinokineospora alba]
MTNPLIAQRQDSTTAISGIGIAESAVDLHNGIESKSWVEAGIGGVGTGLEMLSLALDPVGTLLSYAVSWLMEHVKPLSDALDWLCGDADQIAAYAQTWANVAKETGKVAEDFGNEVKNGTAGWAGEAADAYRASAALQNEQVSAAATCADSIGSTVQVVGVLVGAVREIVRDLVAECVATLIARIPQWIAEIGGTLGIATPHVVASATALIAKWVNRIKDFIKALTKSLDSLSGLLKKLDEIWAGIKKSLPGTRSPDVTPTRASDGVTSPNASTTTPSGSTSPSSASPDGSSTSPSSTTTPSGTTSPDTSTTSPSSTSPSGTTSPNGSSSTSPNGSRSQVGDDPKASARPEPNRKTCGDPIDVASGEMLLTQDDVRLGGALPLVLSRTHLSTYRIGTRFGASWASTLDQRLEVDDEGVCFVTEDGMVLVYPHPGDSPVLPAEGPRWPLLRSADGGYSVTDPESGHTRMFAAATGPIRPIISINDRNGHRVDFDRGADGVATAVRHSGGYRVDVRSEAGLVTALVLAGADEITLIRYGYDAARRLTEVINSSGAALRFDYDSAGRITRWQDRNEMWYRYGYDERGRCVLNEGADGYLSGAFEYRERLTVYTDSLGHRTEFHLNDAYQVVREVDPLGGVTLSDWDRHDRLLARTDPLGRVTRYRYDDDGNLVGIVRPDGTESSATYNALGLPLTVTEVDGAVWRRTYDDCGNLLSITDPMGAVTTFDLDAHGNVTAITDPLGAVRRVESDQAGLPVVVTDPLGASTRYSRDRFGRIAAMTDPLGGSTRLGWTIEGKLISRTQADGAVERWRYDGEGNLVEHIDPAGNTTRTAYTGFDQPAWQVGADGARLEFGYDTNLRLTSVTNPQGLVWRYTYDAVGNLAEETDFNGRRLTYSYDAAGQLVGRANGLGELVSFDRDVLGRLRAKHSGPATTSYEHDALGRMTRTTSPDADVHFERDVLGRVLAETTNGRTVRSVYDPRGNRIRRETPSGAVSEWEYDAAGNAVALFTGGRRMSFGYDAAGREVHRTLDSGTALAQDWDANHRLRSQTLTARGMNVQRRDYQYRLDGCLTAVDDRIAGARRYDLDPAGRVTAVHGAGWTERYAYDAAGNLTQAAWPGEHPAEGTREYTGTRVRRSGTVHFEHDVQGRVLLRRQRALSGQIRAWTYTWDAEDRLVAVTTPDGARWRYRYDGLGRRTAKQRLASTGTEVVEQVDFAWDGLVLAEQTTSGAVLDGPDPAERTTTWEFEPGTFRPVAQRERVRTSPQTWIDAQFYALITDLIGTPTEMVDSDGALAWRSQTTLWGAALAGLGGGPYCPLRFPGQYHDVETGLNYNVHRYYDPATGHYGSADPLGLLAGPNPFAYVGNPTLRSDPLGLTDCARAKKLANKTSERARNGSVREAPNYHGRLSRERELEILSNPDGVYHSTGSGGRFIYRQGDDIVITEGPGSKAGQLVTSYGPSGPRGDSGAAIFGGSSADPGMPITHDMIVNGTIPTPDGGTVPPAIQILP